MREAQAAVLIGDRIAAVRYFDYDYLHAEKGSKGRREATEVEWADPPWQMDACDEMWYGLELETAAGRTFTATWETGEYEHQGYEGLTFVEQTYLDWYDVSWSVAERSRWASALGQLITGVELCWYSFGRRRWRSATDSLLCCHAVVLYFGDSPVYITLGLMRDGYASVEDVSVIFDAELARRFDMGPYWNQNVT